LPRASSLRQASVAFLLIFIFVFSHIQLKKKYEPRFPRFQELVIIEEQAGLQDLAFIVFGFRSVAADMAYIQLLQYLGGSNSLDETNEKNDYLQLKDMTLRVIRLDPYFVRAVLFGSVSLAWLRVINRPWEAVEVLEEGIRYNPTYWMFQSYILAIGYQKSENVDKMLTALGDTLRHPDCPIHVKAILANIFKKNKKYAEALAIWQGVYDSSEDPSYRNRALNQIRDIHQLSAN